MRFLTWCNKIDERSALLFASAKHFGIDVEPIGLGKEYRGGVSKIEWLDDALRGCDQDELIVCTDAHDCIYLNDPSRIFDVWECFCARDNYLIYAGEKWYRKRPPEHQETFDEWAVNEGVPSIYRYPNCGCVMGPVEYVREILDVAMQAANGEVTSEQWVMTGAIAGYPTADVDRGCHLFWCCAGQWKRVPKLAHIENGRLTNLKTGGQPYVLHAPIPNRSRALLRDIAGKLGVPLP